MRTKDQKRRFDDIIELLSNDKDTEPLIIKTYNTQKAFLALKTMEKISGVKSYEGYDKYFEKQDIEGVVAEYYSNYYSNKILLLFYEYIEDYNTCTLLKEIQRMYDIILANVVYSIVGKKEFNEWVEVILNSTIELEKIITETYGENY